MVLARLDSRKFRFAARALNNIVHTLKKCPTFINNIVHTLKKCPTFVNTGVHTLKSVHGKLLVPGLVWRSHGWAMAHGIAMGHAMGHGLA